MRALEEIPELFLITMKVSPPSGGIDSGMSNAPDYFPSWWCDHSWAHEGLL